MRLKIKLGIFSVLIVVATLVNANELRFKHLSKNHELPAPYVNKISQLSSGFMLVSTVSGARLFDGYKFIEFNVKSKQVISPLNSNIFSSVEDSTGNLWFATSLGLYKLPSGANKLERIILDPLNPNSLNDDNVRIIIEDSQQNLWFGTFSGVSKFDPKLQHFTHFSINDLVNKNSHNSGLPQVLLQQNEEALWFGTSTGLFQINPITDEMRRVDGDAGKANIASGLMTNNNQIWFGSHGSGIFAFDISTDKFTNLTRSNTPKIGLHTDEIWNLYQDKNNRIWIGYWGAGLSVYDPNNGKTYTADFRQDDKSSLPNKYVVDIQGDSSGLIWIATIAGIAIFDPLNFDIQSISHIPGDKQSIGAGAVYAIEETPNHLVWLGTENGLERWSYKDNSIKHYYHDPQDEQSITEGPIWALQYVGKNTLMLGTDHGIDLLDIQTGKFQHFSSIFKRTDAAPDYQTGFYSILPKTGNWYYLAGASQSVFLFNPFTSEIKRVLDVSDSPVTAGVEYFKCMLESKNGDFWLGSTNGLFKIDLKTKKIETFSSSHPVNKLSDNHIYGLLETGNGNIWVATANGGINIIEMKEGGVPKISYITEQQGLPSNQVYNLRAGQNNKVWFVSSKFWGSVDTSNQHVKVYTNIKSQGRGFHEGGIKIGENNYIYLAGSELHRFQPKVLKDSNFDPQIRITGVKHLHKTFSGFNPLAAQQAIELWPIDTLVTFEFASLDFTNPELNQYRYQLMGRDDGWLYPGTANTASYTHLPAGKYQLKIQGTNRDGLWSPNIATLNVIMHPPFYRSFWAYLVYFLSAGLILALLNSAKKAKRKIELANMKTLQKSEARLRDVLWGSGDVLWRWELESNKIYKSDNDNLSEDIQEVAIDFATHMAKIHPDDQQSTQDRIDRHLKGEEDHYEAQYRMLSTESQKWTWMLARGRVAEYDENGKPLVVAGTLKNIDALKQTEKQLRYLADYDQLTGLPNRTLFHKHLNHAIETAKRYNEKVALLYLDLNGFKLVNDTLGHATGDLLLKAVSNRLTKVLRTIDRCSRLGGDEFAIIVERVQSADEVLPSLERIVAEIARPFELNEQTVLSSVSVGIAIYPDNAQLPFELLKHADFAMYEAKRDGKKHYQFFNEQMNALFMRRLSIENELKVALVEQQFETFYQARVSVKDNRESGFEALIRWRHPSKGLVSPAEFIPVAEESGLILDIGDWVLKDGCKQAAKWYQQGWRGFVSINIAALQFQQSELVESVKAALTESNLPAECLELEITESTLIKDIELTRNILLNLKKMGVKIALDDFGTGYSSLSYLQQLPLDVLKIDRTFIKLIPHSSKSMRLCTAIINMAHSLDLKVVAEGIEQDAQLRFLQEVLCEEYQGFLFAKPKPPAQIDISKMID